MSRAVNYDVYAAMNGELQKYDTNRKKKKNNK